LLAILKALRALVVIEGCTAACTALASSCEVFNGGLSNVICDTTTDANGDLRMLTSRTSRRVRWHFVQLTPAGVKSSNKRYVVFSITVVPKLSPENDERLARWGVTELSDPSGPPTFPLALKKDLDPEEANPRSLVADHSPELVEVHKNSARRMNIEAGSSLFHKRGAEGRALLSAAFLPCSIASFHN
jgi:hypothetical protein